MGKLKENDLRALKFNSEKGNKTQMYADGGGLSIKVTPSNHKAWYVSYRFHGKQRHLYIGDYPVVTLAEAREKTIEIKRLIRQDINPVEEARREKLQEKQKIIDAKNTFEKVYCEWVNTILVSKRESTRSDYIFTAKKEILPILGNIPVAEITRVQVAELCKGICERSPSFARSVLVVIRHVLNYALDSGLVQVNVAEGVVRVLPKGKESHYKAVTNEQDLSTMLEKIDNLLSGGRVPLPTHVAILTLIHTAMRVSAVVTLKWNDIDLEAGIIEVKPRDGNKTKSGFKVYIGGGLKELLVKYAALPLSQTFVFPSLRGGKTGHMHQDNLRKTLELAGVGIEHCRHAWRQVLKTVASEHGVPSFISELALGHRIGNELENTYNRATYEKILRKFANWYEGALESIRRGEEVKDWEE